MQKEGTQTRDVRRKYSKRVPGTFVVPYAHNRFDRARHRAPPVLTEHFEHFGRRAGPVLGRGDLFLAVGRPRGDGALQLVGAPQPEPDERVQYGDERHRQHEEQHRGHRERHRGQLDVRVHQPYGPDVALRDLRHVVPSRHRELERLRQTSVERGTAAGIAKRLRFYHVRIDVIIVCETKKTNKQTRSGFSYFSLGHTLPRFSSSFAAKGYAITQAPHTSFNLYPRINTRQSPILNLFGTRSVRIRTTLTFLPFLYRSAR